MNVSAISTLKFANAQNPAIQNKKLSSSVSSDPQQLANSLNALASLGKTSVSFGKTVDAKYITMHDIKGKRFISNDRACLRYKIEPNTVLFTVFKDYNVGVDSAITKLAKSNFGDPYMTNIPVSVDGEEYDCPANAGKPTVKYHKDGTIVVRIDGGRNGAVVDRDLFNNILVTPKTETKNSTPTAVRLKNDHPINIKFTTDGSSCQVSYLEPVIQTHSQAGTVHSSRHLGFSMDSQGNMTGSEIFYNDKPIQSSYQN